MTQALIILIVIVILELAWTSIGNILDGVQFHALLLDFEGHFVGTGNVVRWGDWNLLIIGEDATSSLAFASITSVLTSVSSVEALMVADGAKIQALAILLMNIDMRNTVAVNTKFSSYWRELISSSILIKNVLSCVQFLLHILLVQRSNLFIDILNIFILLLLGPFVGMSIWTNICRLWATWHLRFWLLSHHSWLGISHANVWFWTFNFGI